MLNRAFLAVETEEGIHYPSALTILARNRIISNLLPLIRQADSLRRVVSVFGATMEGPIDLDDFEGWHLSRPRQYGHEASITTLALEAHHRNAPDVSFVHNFPGAVESGIARGQVGWLMRTLKTVWAVLGSWVHIPLEEAGDRHLFLCTSARFSATTTAPSSESQAAAAAAAQGVPLVEGLTRARGTDGKEGSGVYSIDANGDSSGPKVEKLLARMRDEGMVEQVWEHIESTINRALATGQKG